MSTRDYFNKGAPKFKAPETQESAYDSADSDVESSRYVDKRSSQKARYVPPIDFTSASNFARYGSSEEYYRNSFKRIYQQFPYDGTFSERTQFDNDSSFLDKYIFDNIYPRTNGHAIFSPSGWGTRTGDLKEGYGLSDSLEYISILGGPNTSSTGMIGIPLEATFGEAKYRTSPGANVYDTDIYGTEGVNAAGRQGTRESNLLFDLSKGITTEFWFDKADWDVSKTKKEVIFDLWNGQSSGSYPLAAPHINPAYGRLLVYATASDAGTDPFRVHLASGSSVWDMSFGGSTAFEALSGSWNHFAFTLFSSSADSQLQSKFYLNGDLIDAQTATDKPFGQVTGSLIGYVGALQTAPSGNAYAGLSMAGYGKLSGSLDEFRYWKTKRTSKDIGRNWFTQVGAGTNTDISNTELGIYYKFNEGISGVQSKDSKVLDYSGRISNGTWVGYAAGARSVGSAIVSASAASSEYKDPILYSEHADVVSKMNQYIASGSVWDEENNGLLYNSYPTFLQEEEEDAGAQHLKQLTQIIGSYFDELHHQIEALPTLITETYTTASAAPFSHYQKMLQSRGFNAPLIFDNATVLEHFHARSEEEHFEIDLEEIKNRIYQNIFNNLTHIYKSKGTEESVRNLIRCYGVGDELIKINLYSDQLTFPLVNSRRTSVAKKRFVNFNSAENFAASVYQQTSSGNTNTTDVTYISGTDANLANTAEIEVLFPKKISSADGTQQYFSTSFLTSSIFGCHSASWDPLVFTWDTGSAAHDFNFELYAVRPERESSDAHFLLKDRAGNFSLTSSLYGDVYDNQKWNFSVRLRNENHPVGSSVTGSSLRSAILEFKGINVVSDMVANEFTLTASLTSSYLTANRRYYVGAHLTNFTGAVNFKSDIRATSLRHWASYLDDETLLAHAKDPENYGSSAVYGSSYLGTILDGMQIPQVETLALNWDFSTVTSASTAGIFTVDDFSSGSSDSRTRYPGTFGSIVGNQYTGQGIGFPASSTSSVVTEYVQSARQQLPESAGGLDMISIPSVSDSTYHRESRIDNSYFTFEKNMYQTVSEEMLNMFGTIVEFNSLIGAPVNRYRQEYKGIGKLRNLFFERIQNAPDIDKYIEYYKWIDSSLSEMILQLIPASVATSEGILNVVESHILERNKYRSKFPMIKEVASTEGGIKGYQEQNYSWRLGHAPLMVAATATVTVADGDADSGMTEKESMTITSTDGTTRKYVVIDDNATTVTTGAALATTSDTGANQAGTHATATITITDYTELNAGDKVNLIATDGTNYNFVQGDQSSVEGTFEATTSNNQTATNLMNVINTSSGPSGTRFSATVDGAVVTATQNTAGTAGNTTVTLTDSGTAGMTKTNFAAGAEVAANSVAVAINTTGTAATQNDFLVQLKAAIESTNGHTGKITVSSVPVEANGAQTITLTQVVEGISGNTATISDDISQTTIVDFAGGDDKENENALWWKERAERSGTGLASGDTSADSVRETLRKRSVYRASSSAPFSYDSSVGSYESSVYKARSLTKVFDFSSDIKESISKRGISFANQKKTYYRGLISFGSTDGLVMSSVQSELDSNDVIDTPKELEKKKKYFTVTGERNQAQAPFTVYSSSVETGYASELSSDFMPDVDITNNHVDNILVTNEISMQGPFAERFVGGSPHRHADINRYDSSKIGPGNLDSAVDRIEAYELSLASGQITVKHQGVNKPRSSYFRDETTKRPVNTRNIKQTTSFVTDTVSGTLQSSIGNFSKKYEVIMASDRSTNNSSFVKAEGFGSASSASPYFSSLNDHVVPIRSKSEHTIVEKFSAPGDAASSILDLESGQFSPYNDLNARNWGVRKPLRDLLSEKSERFGIRSGSSTSAENYSVAAGFHKVNRNSLTRAENISDVNSAAATATVTVADGDAVSGMSEKESMTITSADGTERIYVVIEDNTTAVATGAALATTSDTGAGDAGTHATAVDCIDITGTEASSADVSFTILITTAAGGEHNTTAVTILLDDSATTNPAQTANTIAIGTAGISDAAKAAALIDAINGVSSSLVDLADSGVGQAGVQGVTAAEGTSDTQITLTMDAAGVAGNLTNALTTASGVNVVDVRSFTAGAAVAANSVAVAIGIATATAATAVDCIDLTGVEAASADCSFTILIPTTAGGLGGTAITFLLDDSEASDPAEGANTIAIATAGLTDAQKTAILIKAINAVAHAKTDFASSGNGQAGYNIGVTAAQGSSNTQITLTNDATNFAGNITNAITTVSGVDVVDVRSFTGGLTADTQNAFLVQLKAAIESANGHNGKISVSAVPTEANGAQAITLTQSLFGTIGNTASLSDDISQTTIVDFAGGIDEHNVPAAVVTHDNWYIQHPIPRSDLQYSWISSSYTSSYVRGHAAKDGYYSGSTEGIVPAILFTTASQQEVLGITVDHVGINGLIYEPISTSDSRIGLPIANTADDYRNTSFATIPSARTLNALLIHRGGIYGFSSWKQIANSYNPLVRAWKKENTMAFNASPGNTIVTESPKYEVKQSRFGSLQVFTEPPITSRNFPLKLILDINTRQGKKKAEIESVFGNEIDNFTNIGLDQALNMYSRDGVAYNKIKSLYLDGALDSGSSPVDGFRSLTYEQNIYPMAQNSFLSKTRSRPGYENNFWRSSRANRDVLGDSKFSENSALSGNYSSWNMDADIDFETIRPTGLATATITVADGDAASGMAEKETIVITSTDGTEKTYCVIDDNATTVATGAILAADSDTGASTAGSALVGAIAVAINLTGSASTQNTFLVQLKAAIEHANGHNGKITVSVVPAQANGAQLITLTQAIVGSSGNVTITDDISQTTIAGFTGGADFTTGILQNNKAHVHSGAKQNITASILFHRKHTVAASASVKSRTGKEVSETGSWAAGDGFLLGRVQTHGGNALWQAGSQAGYYDITGALSSSPAYPWVDSYDDYVLDPRAHNKDYSIVPEFRISDNIENYVNNRDGDFLSHNTSFLSIKGATSSNPQNSSESDFYKVYANSDFMKQFCIIREDHRDFVNPLEIKLTCKAIKKFVPYNGFYPSELLVDLYSRFSSSYAHKVSYDGADSIHHSAKIRPFITPLFAPGIWNNMIKSGMAVDYPVFTGSYKVHRPYTIAAATLSDYYLLTTGSSAKTTANDMTRSFIRIPFEATIAPEKYLSNMPLLDMEPHPSSSLNVTASWSGDGDGLYKMKAHNALASMIEFFLPGENNKGSMSTLYSSPESEWKPFVSGTTYAMRIKLRKSYNQSRQSQQLNTNNFPTPHDTDLDINNGLEQTITICSRPTSFGPPMSGREGMKGGSPLDLGSGAKLGSSYYGALDSLTGINPAFEPPYANGEAWADIIYKHDDKNNQPTLDKIQSMGTVVQWRFDPYALSSSNGGSNLHPYGFNNINDFSMQLTSSINVLGKITTRTAKSNVWAIQPKMEVPILNFHNASASVDTPASASVPRSIWSQFGTIPTASTGIYLEVGDIERSWSDHRIKLFDTIGDAANPNYDGDAKGIDTRHQPYFELYGGYGTNNQWTAPSSLADHLGFKKKSKKLGKLAKSRTVKEAVVAIPFLEKEGKREFFEISRKQISTSLSLLGKGEEDSSSVTDMVSKMKEYVFPPKFDFIKYPDDITPFAMYIFEFKHKFDQDDLSYIWQGLQPRSAASTQMSNASIEHKLLAGELMGKAAEETGEPLQSEVRWMVFKVKQKAADNYYKKSISNQSSDTSRIPGQSAQEEIPEYSYNWPYDYFSLVEFAKIDASVKFAPTKSGPPSDDDDSFVIETSAPRTEDDLVDAIQKTVQKIVEEQK